MKFRIGPQYFCPAPDPNDKCFPPRLVASKITFDNLNFHSNKSEALLGTEREEERPFFTQERGEIHDITKVQRQEKRLGRQVR